MPPNTHCTYYVDTTVDVDTNQDIGTLHSINVDTIHDTVPII